MAVLPWAERDTDWPWSAKPPTMSKPTSLGPCCVQTPPLLVQTQAAPVLLLSMFPPTMAVLPSAERDTDWPCWDCPTASEPISLAPCCVQTPPLLVQTQAAPIVPLSLWFPTMAVLASEERDTDTGFSTSPPDALFTASKATNSVPCCVQTPPLLVQTRAAPAPLLAYPPTMAVLPSAERDTEPPW